MSRRSARLLTSGYYSSQVDAESTCCNGSTGPISYKENPFRVFRKKITRRLVGSSRTSSHASSLSESQGRYISDLLMEDELTGPIRTPPELRFPGAVRTRTAGVRKAIFLLFLLQVFGMWYWYRSVTPQRFHTSTKSTTDPTHLVQTPLHDHVFSARLLAMRDDIYAGLREQETKWSESTARQMDSLLIQQDLQNRVKNLKSEYSRLIKEMDGIQRQILYLRHTLHTEVERIVHRALSLSRADGTGMADYALESAGASVINSRSSETYQTRSTYLSLFGIPLWYHSVNPRTVTQPEVYPGKCWAFHGSEGFLVISLSSYPVRITHVSLEHIPRVLSPTGHIDSAPKDFVVYGMTYENEGGKLLGTFTYDQDGEPIQTYQLLESPSEVYRLVELRVLSNWGNPEYTCIYRFRVHGLNVERTERD